MLQLSIQTLVNELNDSSVGDIISKEERNVEMNIKTNYIGDIRFRSLLLSVNYEYSLRWGFQALKEKFD